MVEEHQVSHVAQQVAPVPGPLVHKDSDHKGFGRQSDQQHWRRPWKAIAGNCTCPWVKMSISFHSESLNYLVASRVRRLVAKLARVGKVDWGEVLCLCV